MTTTPDHQCPPVPGLRLTSPAFPDGSPLPIAHHAAMTGADGAADVSPPLAWSGVPDGTRSLVVTMFDPDAPTPSGFWHWVVADLPASTTELAAGAADDLPAGAVHVPNDLRARGYVGAAPPPGTGPHRYVLTVHAVDVASVAELGFDGDGTPAGLSFALLGHTLARATTTAVAEG